MIDTLITNIAQAFGRVVNLIGDIFGGAEEGGIFGAINDLSSGVFGN